MVKKVCIVCSVFSVLCWLASRTSISVQSAALQPRLNPENICAALVAMHEEPQEVTEREFIAAVIEDIDEREEYYGDRMLYHMIATAYPTELTQNN